MSLENPRPRSKRPNVESEEERAWVSFYRRVRHDVAIANEVLGQLEADPESKRSHLALVLCCKESLRVHKARQARNKRVGLFVRTLCHAMLVVPVQSLRRALRLGGDIAVECLPEPVKEPAVAQVRRLNRDPEFAQAAATAGPPAAAPIVATATADAQAEPSRATRAPATRTAA